MNMTEPTSHFKKHWDAFKGNTESLYTQDFGFTVDQFWEKQTQFYDFGIELDKRVPQVFIKRMICAIYGKMIARGEEKIEKLNQENAEKRASGVRFSDRKEIVEDIKILETILKKFKTDFTVRKISEVIEVNDIPDIKKGIINFIEHNYERFIK